MVDNVKETIALIKSALAEGFPVFSRNKEGLVADVIRASYYAVRVHLTNPGLLLPHQIKSGGNIEWLADADDFGLGGSIRSCVSTKYEPQTQDNNYLSSIKVSSLNAHPFPWGKLSNSEVLARWNFIQELIPESPINHLGENILEWYYFNTL